MHYREKTFNLVVNDDWYNTRADPFLFENFDRGVEYSFVAQASLVACMFCLEPNLKNNCVKEHKQNIKRTQLQLKSRGRQDFSHDQNIYSVCLKKCQ